MRKQRSLNQKPQRFQDVEQLIQKLNQYFLEQDLLTNNHVDQLKEQNQTMDPVQLREMLLMHYKDAPISQQTIKALQKRGLFKLTEVQRCSLISALKGQDLLISSKTGSGKTLAFLVPIIENLYRQKWTNLDGLGALILVPTRELAIQVFEVLNSLLKDYHELSFGLLIGGKSLQEEQKQIQNMNILIATPGRMLQHLTDSMELDCSNLKILVFDEADEILTHGFEQTINEILTYLPQEGLQTMLFSATLTKKILELCKMQLKNPKEILLNQDQSIASIKDTTQKQGFQLPQYL